MSMTQTTLTGAWIGHSYGTHPGSIYADITEDAANVTVNLRVNTQGQLSHFQGSAVPSKPLTITLVEHQAAQPAAPVEEVEPTSVELMCKNVADNLIEGEWKSSPGGAGVFRLERYRFAQLPSEPAAQDDRPKPTALQVRELTVNPVYLDLVGVKRLIAKVIEMIPDNPSSIITYRLGNHRVSRHADQFIAETDLPLRVDELVVTAVKQSGVWNKVISITLGHDTNSLRVEWGDVQWVSGTADVLSSFLKEYGSRPLALYRSYFRELHFIALLAFIVFLPSEVWARAELLIGLVVIIIAHNYIVSRITRSRVYLGPPPAYASLYAVGRTLLAVLTTVVGGTCVGVLVAYLRSRLSLP
jgi:hypothetical protein